jgi:hypothetical protein
MTSNEQTSPEQTSTGQDEAREAAQHVADSTESWEHGAEEAQVREHLEEGLDEAGVEVREGEKDKLVEQVRDGDASPEVEQASPDTD